MCCPQKLWVFHFCMSTAPMPNPEASQTTSNSLKGSEKSGRANTGAQTKASFRVWNAVTQSGVHANSLPLPSSADIGRQIAAYPYKFLEVVCQSQKLPHIVHILWGWPILDYFGLPGIHFDSFSTNNGSRKSVQSYQIRIQQVLHITYAALGSPVLLWPTWHARLQSCWTPRYHQGRSAQTSQSIFGRHCPSHVKRWKEHCWDPCTCDLQLSVVKAWALCIFHFWVNDINCLYSGDCQK